MGLWQHASHLAPNLSRVLHHDFRWMTWNLILAWIPVGLAYLLFRRPPDRPRTALWWTGAVLLALFLPNAPYVVSDLVHLRQDVLLVGHGWSVVTGALPVYAAFIAAGFLAYYLVLRELGRYLTSCGLGAWVGPVTLATHAVCAFGIYLGRHARLNSWEPVVQPHDTLQRVVLTLSWRWGPVLVLATFLVTWAGHFVTRAVCESAWQRTLHITRHVVGWA